MLQLACLSGGQSEYELVTWRAVWNHGHMALPTPTLQAERLRLRPFTDADADDLFALQSDSHVLRYWDSPPWTDKRSIARFMAKSRQMAEAGSGARVASERTVDQVFIGWCP